MKTELTKKIEQAICYWSPSNIGDIKINSFRNRYTVTEVPVEHSTTKGGIVDAVCISEYFRSKDEERFCFAVENRKKGLNYFVDCPYGKCLDSSDYLQCDIRNCKLNGKHVMYGDEQILCTCFEIKITVSDFKSSHGHNFFGNMNYYVVPVEIYQDIKSLVPEDIGILIYYHNSCSIRTKKKPTYREMTDEQQKWILLSVMKRLADTYQKRLSESQNQKNSIVDDIL